jgi:hypothetical protein
MAIVIGKEDLFTTITSLRDMVWNTGKYVSG